MSHFALAFTTAFHTLVELVRHEKWYTSNKMEWNGADREIKNKNEKDTHTHTTPSHTVHTAHQRDE